MWSLQFSGGHDLAAKRAARAFRALRNPHGSWNERLAKAPDNTEVQIYAGADQSPKQRILIWLGEEALTSGKTDGLFTPGNKANIFVKFFFSTFKTTYLVSLALKTD